MSDAGRDTDRAGAAGDPDPDPDPGTESAPVVVPPDAFEGGRRLETDPVTLATLAGVAAVCALGAYETAAFGREAPFVLGWIVDPLDWLFAASLVVCAGALARALRRPGRAGAVLRRLLARPRGAFAVVWLAGLAVAGLLGPVVVARPRVNAFAVHQPPVGLSVPADLLVECVGPVVDGRCRGTLRYPLGTTVGGRGVLAWMLHGARLALEVTTVAAVLLVPVGTLVGVVAGTVGGRVDGLLMRYVDAQQALPAVLVYVVLRFLYGGSPWLLVVVFGLFDWGGTARLVREETRSLSDAGYLEAARSAGASPLHLIRRHVLPNVAGAVATGLARTVALLVLTEAALTFLEISGYLSFSWGRLVADELGGLNYYWWAATIPVVAIAGTVVAATFLGDALQAALEPRGE